MRIVWVVIISALVSEIYNAKEENPGKMEKLVKLSEEIFPGMKDQSFPVTEILKILKVF